MMLEELTKAVNKNNCKEIRHLLSTCEFEKDDIVNLLRPHSKKCIDYIRTLHKDLQSTPIMNIKRYLSMKKNKGLMIVYDFMCNKHRGYAGLPDAAIMFLGIEKEE